MSTEEPRIVMGDLVRVADEMPSGMSHFRSGGEAIVIGSYSDLYYHGEPRNDKEFSLLFCDTGERSSWYPGDLLTFVRHATREDVLKAREARRR